MNHADIYINIMPPRYEKEMKIAYRIDERGWYEDGLAPLPKWHDSPLNTPEQRLEILRYRDKRRESIRRIAERLARYIEGLIEESDPKDGYTPEERPRISR